MVGARKGDICGLKSCQCADGLDWTLASNTGWWRLRGDGETGMGGGGSLVWEACPRSTGQQVGLRDLTTVREDRLGGLLQLTGSKLPVDMYTHTQTHMHTQMNTYTHHTHIDIHTHTHSLLGPRVCVRGVGGILVPKRVLSGQLESALSE